MSLRKAVGKRTGRVQALAANIVVVFLDPKRFKQSGMFEESGSDIDWGSGSECGWESVFQSE
jgi:hypothetical protein